MCPLYSMTPILNHKDTTCPHMTSPFQLGSFCLAKYSGAKCTLKWLVLRRLSSCRNPPKTDNEAWCSSCPLLAPTFFSSCFLLAPVLCWLQPLFSSEPCQLLPLSASILASSFPLSAPALVGSHLCQLLPLVDSCSLLSPLSCQLLALLVSTLVGFCLCWLPPLSAPTFVLLSISPVCVPRWVTDIKCQG